MKVKGDFFIRKIKEEDNLEIQGILSSVMREFDVPETGTALADPELKNMFQSYQAYKSSYYVILKNNSLVGGAGISELKNSNDNTCELQKMYFLKEARGKGLGNLMIDLCLKSALEYGFEKCYIETMHNMNKAQSLYLKKGFSYLQKPLGNTGHCSCPIWMIKNL
jgi:putative acetyltransferase